MKGTVERWAGSAQRSGTENQKSAIAARQAKNTPHYRDLSIVIERKPASVPGEDIHLAFVVLVETNKNASSPRGCIFTIPKSFSSVTSRLANTNPRVLPAAHTPPSLNPSKNRTHSHPTSAETQTAMSTPLVAARPPSRSPTSAGKSSRSFSRGSHTKMTSPPFHH